MLEIIGRPTKLARAAGERLRGEPMTFDYDLFVIGGGSGGIRAARLAAAEGAKVALAEEYRLGGTCVIRGCIPKKLMVYASDFADAFKNAGGYGWSVEGAEFDWSRFITAKDLEIDRLEGIYRKNLDNAGVEVFSDRAVLDDSHTVLLGSGRRIVSRFILVASGGSPFVPKIPGAEQAATSNDVFQFESLPARVLIVGGGYIACEFAGILNGMGSEVLQCYRGEQILRGFDDDIRSHVSEAMSNRGIDLRLETRVEKISPSGTSFEVEVSGRGNIVVDTVIYATGRTPNTGGLNLESAGVELTPKGAVVVDEYSQTAVPSIFAIGDVTDRINLTPVAIREGAAFVETVFKGNPTPVDHADVPTAAFTRPEVGTVGLTEAQASEAGPVDVYLARFRPLSGSLSGKTEQVLMKLVVGRPDRRVLGVHIVGEGAAEMIQLAAVAVKMKATKEDFDRTVAVHPTAAEELVTFKEPARST